MATATGEGTVALTSREARILRRVHRSLDKLDAAAAARALRESYTPPMPAGVTTPNDTPRTLQRPSKAPKWLQRLIVRRATRTRPQERAAFALGLFVGIVATAVVIGAVIAGASEAAR